MTRLPARCFGDRGFSTVRYFSIATEWFRRIGIGLPGIVSWLDTRKQKLSTRHSAGGFRSLYKYQPSIMYEAAKRIACFRRGSEHDTRLAIARLRDIRRIPLSAVRRKQSSFCRVFLPDRATHPLPQLRGISSLAEERSRRQR